MCEQRRLTLVAPHLFDQASAEQLSGCMDQQSSMLEQWQTRGGGERPPREHVEGETEALLHFQSLHSDFACGTGPCVNIFDRFVLVSCAADLSPLILIAIRLVTSPLLSVVRLMRDISFARYCMTVAIHIAQQTLILTWWRNTNCRCRNWWSMCQGLNV